VQPGADRSNIRSGQNIAERTGLAIGFNPKIISGKRQNCRFRLEKNGYNGQSGRLNPLRCFGMLSNSITRFVRRGFSASMVWAMIPLAALAGLPTASCACLKCQCGAACEFASHSASSRAGGEPAGCSTCCCNHCPCAGTSHCCCLAKLAAAKKLVCQHLPGKGFNSPESSGCRTSITAVAGIRATTVAIADGYQPLSLDVPAVALSDTSSGSLDRTSLNGGPPVDLVVTLRRLVI